MAEYVPITSNVEPEKGKDDGANLSGPDSSVKCEKNPEIPHKTVNDELVDHERVSNVPLKTRFTCKYCNQSFSYKGTYGRHLDQKKGDALHPHDEITKIRSSVIRRLGKQPRSTKVLLPSLATSKVLSRNEYSQDPIEISKVRRKLRDRRIKSKLLIYKWLLDQFGTISKADESSFADLVCLYLPIKQWPINYPDNLCYKQVMDHVEKRQDMDLKEKLSTQFVEWQCLDQEQKRQIWDQTKTQMLSRSIGEFCIADLGQIKSIVNVKEQQMFEQFCDRDNLLQYVDKNKMEVEAPSDSETDDFNQYFSI